MKAFAVTIDPALPKKSRRLTLLFFLFCLSVYLAISPGRIGGSDATEMLHLAEALGKGRLSIDPVPGWSFQGPDGNWYSRYGLGYPAILVPFMKAGAVAAKVVGRFPELYFTRFSASLVNPLLVGAAAAALFRLLCGIGFSTRRGLAVASLYGFGSIAFPQTKDGLSEPAATLFLVLACLCVRTGIREGKAGMTAAGGLLSAAAILTRPFLAVGLLGPALYLAVTGKGGSRLRQALAFAVPVMAGASLQLWYNAARTGSALSFGYGPAGAIFGVPPPGEMGYRLASMLLAPGCGLVVWQPFLLLVPFGLAPLWRRSRTESAVVAGLVLPLFATVWVYEDWALVPRLLAPALPSLSVLVAAAFDRPLLSRARVAVWAGVFGLSVLAQVPSVLVPAIRMESRLALEGRQRDYWSPATAPAIGGWQDVVAVSRVPADRELIYSSSGLPVGGPKEWFERSATLNSFAFWFVHAGRLGVPGWLLAVLTGIQGTIAAVLAWRIWRQVFPTAC